MHSINFIGCGKLGKTLAYLFQHYAQEKAHIAGICNRTIKSSNAAVTFVGGGNAIPSLTALPPADIYFITTKDSLIQSICEELSQQSLFKPGSIVLHCSGALSSEVLAAAKSVGCHIASVHPCKSFAAPAAAVQNFAGVFCAFEGDDAAFEPLNDLLHPLGANLFRLDNAKKKIYHTAAVLANNYAITLHHNAYRCYLAAGIESEIAFQIALSLTQDAMDNLANTHEHAAALTGPIQRGDVAVVRDHLCTLQAEKLLDISHTYQALGLSTLEIAKENLAPEVIEKLQRILA